MHHGATEPEQDDKIDEELLAKIKHYREKLQTVDYYTPHMLQISLDDWPDKARRTKHAWLSQARAIVYHYNKELRKQKKAERERQAALRLANAIP
jgi:hypothetical protein